MAPLLFKLVFSAMFYDAFHDNDLGALIRFRTDGNVFNLRRLNSKTRTSKVLIRYFIFADDCALLAHTVDDSQAITNAFARSAHRFGLTISLKKTEVIYQPKPRADYTAPTITIDNIPLNVTDKFTYCLLGQRDITERINRRRDLGTDWQSERVVRQTHPATRERTRSVAIYQNQCVLCRCATNTVVWV